MRAVLFDAGGVLVGPDWARLAADAAHHSVRVDAARLAAQEGPALAVMRGGTDAERWRSYVAAALALAEADGPVDTAAAALQVQHDLVSYWDAVYPDVRACLATLSHRVRLGVVSNSNGRLLGVLRRLGLADAFDVVIDSAVVGVEKPDPRIFALALDALAVPPGATAFVGDHPDLDVRGAAAAGLVAVHLDRHGAGSPPGFAAVSTLAALPELLELT
jgi:putative hydrolase of the HAD superfamily